MVEKKQSKNTYYYLPLDNYNQPNGLVEKVELTEEEFKQAKANGHYIYGNYQQAMYRAMD